MQRKINYLLAVLMLATCALSAQQVTWDRAGATPKTAPVKSAAYQSAYNDVQIGNATYYADYLIGRPTAYGETYQADQLTASHAHLPIGTLLEVRRLDNGAAVKVRVNDNNGHSDGSLVVLSKLAAQQLDLMEVGKSRVSVKRVGFSNWNPQPQRMSNQLTAKGGAVVNQYTTPNQNNALKPTAYNNGYRQQPVTYDNNPVGVSQPDFTDVQYRQADPTAYRPATRPETVRSSATPYPNQGTPYVYGTPDVDPDDRPAVKAPAIVAREVSNPVYNQGMSPKGVTTYGRSQDASVAPVSEVQVVSNTLNVGYAIQLAAYGNAENAQRQVRALQNQGIENVYVTTVARADGMTLNRVMVGPFSDAAVAQATADRLYREKQVRGIVTRLP